MNQSNIHPSDTIDFIPNFTNLKKNAVFLSILLGLMVVFPVNMGKSNQIAPNSFDKSTYDKDKIVRFNRRFIQINDYLFNGTEGRPAIACDLKTQSHGLS